MSITIYKGNAILGNANNKYWKDRKITKNFSRLCYVVI